MTVPFNAVDFRAEIGQQPGKASHYLIKLLNVPKVLQEDMLGTTKPRADPVKAATLLKKATWLAQQAEQPARQIDTQERRYNGPMKAVPIGHTYTTINVDFVENREYDVREFFTWWQESLQDPATAYRVPYYNEFVVDMHIELYDVDGRIMRRYIVYDAYPITITTSQMGWSMVNQSMVTNIEFQYYRWELDTSLEVEEPRGRKMPDRKGRPGNKFTMSPEDLARASKIANIVKKIQKVAQKFHMAVDLVRNANNTIEFAKNSVKQARDIARSLKNIKIKTGSFKEFTRSMSDAGKTVRGATDKVSNFGSGVQTINKKFDSFSINKFFE
jgi:hypothetical protein